MINQRYCYETTKESVNDDVMLDSRKRVTPRKRVSAQNCRFLDEAEEVVEGTRDPIKYFNDVTSKIDKISYQQKEELSKDFKFKKMADFIFSTENDEIIARGLVMISKIIISPRYRAPKKLLTSDFLEKIFPVFMGEPGPLYEPLLSLIYGVLVNNDELLGPIAEDLFSKINEENPTKYVVLIADMYLKVASDFTERAAAIYIKGAVSDDLDTACSAMISIKRLLRGENAPELQAALIEGAVASIQKFLNAGYPIKIYDSYNSQQNLSIRKMYEQCFLLLSELPTEIELQENIFSLTLTLLRGIDYGASQTNTVVSAMVCAATKFLRAFSGVYQGKDDEAVCETMRYIIANGNFDTAASAFSCMLNYFHFDEWFDEEFGEMLVRYAENTSTAAIIFEYFISILQTHSEDEALLEIADRLTVIAEEMSESGNSKLAEKADAFAEALSSIE